MNKIEIPRLRMFAGPNGSGKSTVKLNVKPELLGIYVNPDDIEQTIKVSDYLDFTPFGIITTQEEVLNYFLQSTLLKKADLIEEARELSYSDNKLSFWGVNINSYFASVAADFIRQKLIASKQSFTFETVMSSPDKIAFLKKAQEAGYRTYLYYVATENPIINISRVKHRVRIGGHPVPEDKIVSRYYRSLDLLKDAIKYTNRAYIFDNSGEKQFWLAEITDAKEIQIKSEYVPEWFVKYVIEKL